MFVTGCLILTLAFRLTLSHAIDTGGVFGIAATAVGYFGLLFTLGWFTGSGYYRKTRRADITFSIHFISYLSFFAISLLWFIWGNRSDHEKLWHVYLALGIWSPVLLYSYVLHQRHKQDYIDGIDKSTLFE